MRTRGERQAMRVSAPLEKSTRSVAADWVELQALITDTSVGEQHLIRSQSVQAEPEHGNVLTEFDLEPADEEILEPENDEFSQRVHEELVYRERVLGELYPFEILTEYGKWMLRRRPSEDIQIEAAHACYICCLLIAAIHSDLLPLTSGHDLFKRSAKIMQIESYLAAAEILGGKAYWFGFPRPDHSGMLTAVQRLVQEMGVGLAHEQRPTGVSAEASDGTVDVVAWRPFRDGQYAAVVAYGQVASGRNWESKPIKAFIDGNFFPWFVKKPSHEHIEMLFVPIIQHHEMTERERHSEDFWVVAREQARLREMDFGVVIDRLRMTELMAASKVSGRYDAAEYETHEVAARVWAQETLSYAGSA
jgi:hypothetical protein